MTLSEELRKKPSRDNRELLNRAADRIDELEAADCKECAGEWLEENNRPKSSQFICSLCGGLAYSVQPSRIKNQEKQCAYKFCPHCGAKMKGGAV